MSQLGWWGTFGGRPASQHWPRETCSTRIFIDAAQIHVGQWAFKILFPAPSVEGTVLRQPKWVQVAALLATVAPELSPCCGHIIMVETAWKLLRHYTVFSCTFWRRAAFENEFLQLIPRLYHVISLQTISQDHNAAVIRTMGYDHRP